jgi:phosphoglycolate phosphatase-like HAD superfamily hydrolase
VNSISNSNTKTKRPPLFIFDVDNTLIHQKDSTSYFKEILIESLKNFNLSIPIIEEITQFWEAGSKYPEILSKWGVKDIKSFWDEFDRRDYKNRSELARKGSLSIDKDAQSVLSKLFQRDIILTAYSNSNYPITDFLLKHFNLREFFKRVKGLSPGKPPNECKPEIGGLSQLISELGYNLDTDEIYLIGDSVTDILAASRLKIKGFLYNSSATIDSIKKKYPELNSNQFKHIKALNELLDIVPFHSKFGYWDGDQEGLPQFHYTADQHTLPEANTFTTYGQSKDHFHQIGNTRWMATVHNNGRVQLMDSSYGFLWLTHSKENSDPSRSAGIAYYQLGPDKKWDSDSFHARDNEESDKKYKMNRIFGAYYFEKQMISTEFNIKHRISMPPLDIPVIESLISIQNTSKEVKNVQIVEMWPIYAYYLAKSSIVMLGNRTKFGPTRLLNATGHAIKWIQKIFQTDTLSGRNRWAKKIKYELNTNQKWEVDGITFSDISSIRLLYKSSKFANQLRCNRPQAYPPKLKTIYIIPILSQNEDLLRTNDYVHGFPIIPNANDLWTVFQGKIKAESSKAYRVILIYCDPEELPVIIRQYLSISNTNWGQSWKQLYCSVRIPGEGWLFRESMWHSAYVLGGMYFEEFIKAHKLPQGSIYAYGHGFDGSIRDYAFYLPAVIHSNPSLAREFLIYILSLMTEEGQLLYGTFGYAHRMPFVHTKASDLYIFILWAISEYIYLTRDFSFLNVEIPFYPEISKKGQNNRISGTIIQRIEKSIRYLLSDAVGIGSHGALKINDGDWSDGITFLVKNRSKFMKEGESLFNTAMAIAILPQLIPLLENYLPQLGQQLQELMPRLEKALDLAWNGSWFYRAWDGNRDPVGDKELFLEHHAWVLIANRLPNTQREKLLAEIHSRLENSSEGGQLILNPPLPSLLNIFPKGWDVNGGIWYCINFLLTIGYAKMDLTKSIDSLFRNSMANRMRIYPNIWYGQWTGPDCYNAPYAPRPGEAFFHLPTPMCDFPAFNMNLHAGFLTACSALFGLQAENRGFSFDIRRRIYYSFTTTLYSIEYTESKFHLSYKSPYFNSSEILFQLIKDPTQKIEELNVKGFNLLKDSRNDKLVSIILESINATQFKLEIKYKNEENINN